MSQRRGRASKTSAVTHLIVAAPHLPPRTLDLAKTSTTSSHEQAISHEAVVQLLTASWQQQRLTHQFHHESWSDRTGLESPMQSFQIGRRKNVFLNQSTGMINPWVEVKERCRECLQQWPFSLLEGRAQSQGHSGSSELLCWHRWRPLPRRSRRDPLPEDLR